MKIRYVKWLIVVISLISNFTFCKNTYADISNKGMDFGIRAVKQDNQISNNTYFDLAMRENQKQLLPIEISNSSDTELHVKVTVVDATTTSKSEVQYLTDNAYPKAKGMRLTDLVDKKEQIIVIPANKTKIVEVQLQTPPKFSGIILGGLRVEKINLPTTKTDEDSNNISINNKYSYVIGIQLHFKDVNKQSFDFSLGNITLGKVNYRKQLIVDINNDNHRLMKNIETNVNIKKITDDKNETKVVEETQNGSYAPLNTMQMRLDSTAFVPGDYQAKVTINQGNMTKTLVKKFHISKQDVENASQDTISDTTFNWRVIGGIIVLASSIIVLFIVKWKYKSH